MARRRFGRVTPFRVGSIIGETESLVEPPYGNEKPRALRLYFEGVEFGRRVSQPRKANAPPAHEWKRAGRSLWRCSLCGACRRGAKKPVPEAISQRDAQIQYEALNSQNQAPVKGRDGAMG